MSKPAFALVALSLIACAPAAADDDLSDISFQLSANRHGSAQLALQYSSRPGSNSNHSNSYPWSNFSGVDASDLGGASHPVSFTVSRGAGVLSCNGQAQNGRASGFCDFAGSQAYAEGLERRGIRGAEGVHLLHLALCDFDLAALDEFERLGYDRPSLDDVMAVAVHGVDADYARGMAEAGYRLGDVGELVAMRIHGVTPDYVRSLASLGPAWRNIPADDILALRIHGVTSEFAREMSALGYSNEEPSQLVAMRIHGVESGFVRELRELGFRDISSDDLIAARIHGVTPDYVREIQEAGYRDLSIDQLISMRIHGVDSRYARAMRRRDSN
ncbi:MAG TPA: hypothetical protein VEF55_12740 [Candidatus Binatia bacterium]|nr:hypothetical protein [Candidatus Binatia bacterium]